MLSNLIIRPTYPTIKFPIPLSVQKSWIQYRVLLMWHDERNTVFVPIMTPALIMAPHVF